MAAGVIAFFTALPAVIQLISQLGRVFEKLLEAAQTNDLNGWINNLEKQIDALEKAKTPEQKLDAAKGLASIIRGIGK